MMIVIPCSYITPEAFIFDPATALIISTTTGESDNILEAVDRGVVSSNTVKVIEPQTGKQITLKHALDRGIIDKKTGEYKDNSGKKLSLTDAAKVGLIAVIGAPLVAASKVIQVVKSTMVEDPRTGEKLPMEVAYERGLVDPATYKKYEESIRERSPDSDSANISTSKVIKVKKTMVIDPSTGEQIPIEDAYERHLIDPATYREYVDSTKKFSPESSSVHQTTSKVSQIVKSTWIVDPKTGEKVPLEVAYERGLVDPATFKEYMDSKDRIPIENKPIQTSRVIEVVKKTMIINPKTGEEMPIEEAYERGLVDPATYKQHLESQKHRSPEGDSKDTKVIKVSKTTVIVDPKTGEKLPIEEAFKRGLVDPITYNQYVDSRNRSPENMTEHQKPPRSIRVTEKTVIVNPNTGEEMPIEVAYEKGLVDQATYKTVSL